MTVRDKVQGEANREDGIVRANQGASFAWKRDVDDAIHWVATRQREFTTDDVWERLAQVSTATTREHRAMGPVMRAAQAKGWIESTYSYRPTERPSRNRAPVRVWRSRIYRVQARREQMA